MAGISGKAAAKLRTPHHDEEAPMQRLATAAYKTASGSVKRHKARILFLALSLGHGLALSPASAYERDASYDGGISLTHARWSDGLGFNERMGYDFDTKLHTKVEGKLADRKSG